MQSRISDLAGFIFFAALTGILIFRLRLGIDLSDESYYAIFINDWLTGGIKNSFLLTVHQTAAFIVYPFAWFYYKITGSTQGLFLFLRYIFLSGSLLAASAWIIFFKKAKFNDLICWGSGVIILAFIPFGLPAPSYNTLSCQFLTIALATFGCAAFSESIVWIFLSACAWTVAVIAYPSLMVPLGFFSLAVLYFRENILKRYKLYFFFLTVSFLAGAFLISYFLSFERMYHSVLYLSAINGVTTFSQKFEFVVSLFQQSKIFTILFFAACVVGMFRKYFNEDVRLLLMATIILPLLWMTPIFYQHAHDVVTLLALMGLGLMTDLTRKSPTCIFSLIFITSFIASIVICFTATNSLYNFCIGAIPAALLAMTVEKNKKSGILLMSLVLTVILSTSLFIFYGEIPNNTPHKKRHYISQGFFAGMLAQTEDADLLSLIDREFSGMIKPPTSAAIFGRVPGISLALPAKLNMLTAFPLMPNVAKKGLDMTHAFYTQAKHRPDWVLVYEDQYFAPVNPMQPDFNSWYILAKTIKTPLGKLTLYQRI